MDKSKATKINTLIRKHKKLMGSYFKIVGVKEPFAMLIRRTQEIEFFENATKGEFQFKHSDGSDRTIYLTPFKKFKFPYGDKEFRGYILHEDIPVPLPENPLVTSEEINIVVRKSLNDLLKMNAEQTRALGEMWWKILIGLACLGGLYVLYRIVIPAPVKVVSPPLGMVIGFITLWMNKEKR